MDTKFSSIPVLGQTTSQEIWKFENELESIEFLASVKC